MELVLAATEIAGNDSIADIEETTEKLLKDWLTTFEGWGLLSSIAPLDSL